MVVHQTEKKTLITAWVAMVTILMSMGFAAKLSMGKGVCERVRFNVVSEDDDDEDSSVVQGTEEREVGR